MAECWHNRKANPGLRSDWCFSWLRRQTCNSLLCTELVRELCHKSLLLWEFTLVILLYFYAVTNCSHSRLAKKQELLFLYSNCCFHSSYPPSSCTYIQLLWKKKTKTSVQYYFRYFNFHFGVIKNNFSPFFFSNIQQDNSGWCLEQWSIMWKIKLNSSLYHFPKHFSEP